MDKLRKRKGLKKFLSKLNFITMEGPNLIIKEENIDLDDLVLVPNTQENLEDYFQVKDEVK